MLNSAMFILYMSSFRGSSDGTSYTAFLYPSLVVQIRWMDQQIQLWGRHGLAQ